jgi:hypothetical protein
MGTTGSHVEGYARRHGGRAARHTMHGLDLRCRQMLADAGFTYEARSAAWSNRESGLAISFDPVAEHTPQWLAGWLARAPAQASWRGR